MAPQSLDRWIDSSGASAPLDRRRRLKRSPHLEGRVVPSVMYLGKDRSFEFGEVNLVHLHHTHLSSSTISTKGEKVYAFRGHSEPADREWSILLAELSRPFGFRRR